MGTRSFIITANPKGDFTGIYCHWDGYPSHNGKLLLEHYNSKGKARELVRLGSLSSLGERAKPLNPEAHSFNNKEEDTTVAYHRDRGEAWAGVKPTTAEPLSELVSLADEATGRVPPARNSRVPTRRSRWRRRRSTTLTAEVKIERQAGESP